MTAALISMTEYQLAAETDRLHQQVEGLKQMAAHPEMFAVSWGPPWDEPVDVHGYKHDEEPV